jgi:lysozyme family protein
MMDRFPICYPVTAQWEGGWSNNKADPGGKTMYGITETRWWEYQDKMGWTRTPVRTVTVAMALVFYRSEFWNACDAPNLFPGVDLAVFDVSVNSGVGRGKRYRDQTASISNPAERVKSICRARLSFLQGLKIWKTFGKGWGRRVADIEARGVMMALSAMGHAPATRKAEATIESARAQVEQKKAASATKATAAVTSGTGANTAIFSDHTALYIIGGLVVVGIIAALILYARQKAAQARADAYSVIQGEQQ